MEEPDSRTSSVGRKRMRDESEEEFGEVINISDSSEDEQSNKRAKPNPEDTLEEQVEAVDISDDEVADPLANVSVRDVPIVSANAPEQPSDKRRLKKEQNNREKYGDEWAQAYRQSFEAQSRLPLPVPDHLKRVPVGLPATKELFNLVEVRNEDGTQMSFDDFTLEKFMGALVNENEKLMPLLKDQPGIWVYMYGRYLPMYYEHLPSAEKIRKRDLAVKTRAKQILDRMELNSQVPVPVPDKKVKPAKETRKQKKARLAAEQEAAKAFSTGPPPQDAYVEKEDYVPLDEGEIHDSPQAPQSIPEIEVGGLNWSEEIELQKKYFPVYNGNPFIPRCLCCGEIDHTTSTCPALICAHCESDQHFSHACIRNHRCEKCGEKGHVKLVCNAKLGLAPGEKIGCNICLATDHDECDCHMIWRTYKVPDLVKKVDDITMNCYSCGSMSHMGDECGLRRQISKADGNTWTLANRNLYIDEQSNVRAVSAGKDFRIKKNFSIKGKAQEDPINLDSDEEDFLHPPVTRQSDRRSMRINPNLPARPNPVSNWASSFTRQPEPYSQYQSNSRSNGNGGGRYARESTFSPPPRFSQLNDDYSYRSDNNYRPGPPAPYQGHGQGGSAPRGRGGRGRGGGNRGNRGRGGGGGGGSGKTRSKQKWS